MQETKISVHFLSIQISFNFHFLTCIENVSIFVIFDYLRILEMQSNVFYTCNVSDMLNIVFFFSEIACPTKILT